MNGKRFYVSANGFEMLESDKTMVYGEAVIKATQRARNGDRVALVEIVELYELAPPNPPIRITKIADK